MLDPALLLAAKADSLISSDSLVKVGGAAGVFALVGIAFVLPLFLTQRREIRRLLLWMELEPHRGDERPPALFTGNQAAGSPPQRKITTGEMTPAERVTADRPALERITAERAALESPSFWTRLIARGPRHPLALSVVAVLAAVAIVAGVVLGIGGVGDGSGGNSGGLERAEVDVAILNGSSEKDLAKRVSNSVSAVGFTQVRQGSTGKSGQTVVLYAPQQKRPAEALARELGAKVVQKLKRSQEAVAAGADVVVIAGEDRARG